MFDRTSNLLSGIQTIIEHYKDSDNIYFSDKIGVLLYSKELKNFGMLVLQKNHKKFHELIYEIDEVYSSVVNHMTYKDGSENKNTLYGVLFGLAIDACNALEEEFELLESTEEL